MRQIKFRGKGEGNWYKGNLVIRQLADSTLYFIVPYDEHKVEYCVTDTTIGQFTGVKDKNNIEIYEGDILNIGHTASVYVGWDSVTLSFILYRGLGHKSNVTLDSVFSSSYEVVGNIYDNMELLSNE